MGTPYRILVTGSRYATPAAHAVFIEDVLGKVRDYRDVHLMHGAAPGVDTICSDIAKSWGWDVTAMPAKWGLLGKAAGPLRNRAMVNTGHDVVLAFLLAGAENKGTRDCAEYAESQGLKVRRFELPAL